jgi:hypothetical protein
MTPLYEKLNELDDIYTTDHEYDKVLTIPEAEAMVLKNDIVELSYWYVTLMYGNAFDIVDAHISELRDTTTLTQDQYDQVLFMMEL